jgi:lipopolysaccharide/colanic/teichoic acid biosynthesis glycosyltransferase
LEQRQVLEFKPGITGPAALAFVDEERWLAAEPNHEDFYTTSVLGRKLALDLLYCQQVTFRGDVRLIFDTIKALVLSTRRSGAASEL